LAFIFNKVSRIESVAHDVQLILERGFSTRAERDTLRGRLQFIERHVYGRSGTVFINLLEGGEPHHSGKVFYDDEYKLGLLSLVLWLQQSKPRQIRPDDERPPLLIFTDGAEGDIKDCTASCGALMVDPVDGTREFFGSPIPEALIAEWKTEGKERISIQAELLPVLLAKRVWKSRMLNRRVLFFVDNETAKFACVNMMSKSFHCRRILSHIVQFDICNQNWTWYSRVASYSNPSDAASRLNFSDMILRFNAMHVNVSIPLTMA
jgi:hypothetical protein